MPMRGCRKPRKKLSSTKPAERLTRNRVSERQRGDERDHGRRRLGDGVLAAQRPDRPGDHHQRQQHGDPGAEAEQEPQPDLARDAGRQIAELLQELPSEGDPRRRRDLQSGRPRRLDQGVHDLEPRPSGARQLRRRHRRPGVLAGEAEEEPDPHRGHHQHVQQEELRRGDAGRVRGGGLHPQAPQRREDADGEQGGHGQAGEHAPPEHAETRGEQPRGDAHPVQQQRREDGGHQDRGDPQDGGLRVVIRVFCLCR